MGSFSKPQSEWVVKNTNSEQTLEGGEGVSHANLNCRWENISDREKK